MNRYSVGNVDGTGKDAIDHPLHAGLPRRHVDGIEALLYPIEPPR